MTASPRPTTRGLALVAVTGALWGAVATGQHALAPLAVGAAVVVLLAPVLAGTRAGVARRSAVMRAHLEPATPLAGDQLRLAVTVARRPGTRRPPLLGVEPPEVTRPITRGETAPAGTPPRSCRWLAPPVVGLQPLGAPPVGGAGPTMVALAARRRGTVRVGPLRSWSTDPFGLVGVPGPVAPAVTVTVWPQALAPPPGSLDVVLGRRPGTTGIRPEPALAVSAAAGSGPGELVGLRPYVPGDRLSLLHWPARARTGLWFVREFGPEGAPTVAVVLDDRAGVHGRVAFERLVSSALGLVDAALAEGRTVALAIWSGAGVELTPAGGPAAARRFLADRLPVRAAGRLTPDPAGTVILTSPTGAARAAWPAGTPTVVVP